SLSEVFTLEWDPGGDGITPYPQRGNRHARSLHQSAASMEGEEPLGRARVRHCQWHQAGSDALRPRSQDHPRLADPRAGGRAGRLGPALPPAPGPTDLGRCRRTHRSRPTRPAIRRLPDSHLVAAGPRGQGCHHDDHADLPRPRIATGPTTEAAPRGSPAQALRESHTGRVGPGGLKVIKLGNTKAYQYTACDDCTRLRVLRL